MVNEVILIISLLMNYNPEIINEPLTVLKVLRLETIPLQCRISCCQTGSCN